MKLKVGLIIIILCELFLITDTLCLHVLHTDPVCTEYKRLKSSGTEWNMERYKAMQGVINCN